MILSTPAARAALVLSITAVFAFHPSAVVADEASEQRLEDFYAAIGGRDVWANGRGEYVLAKVEDPRFALPGTFELCWSWLQAKTSARARFQDLSRVRSFDGSEGWTLEKPGGNGEARLRPWDADRIAQARLEWRGNFEVLAHRMAKRDPAVTTRMGDGPWRNWIRISVDDDVQAYLLLGDDGAPKKFQRLFDDVAVVFGPLADRGVLRFPEWGAFEGGQRFDLVAFEILETEPAMPFAKPSAQGAALLDCR